MGMRTMLQVWPGFPRSLAAGVACAALFTVGCTMCPDPYDYSGPVPNGSTPQNDFRARSNGILPIGAAPQPYPTVVKATQPVPEAAPIVQQPVVEQPVVEQPVVEQPVVEQPVVEQPVVEQPVVAEAEDDVLRLTAEVPVIPEADAAEGPAPEAAATVESVATPDTGAEAVHENSAQPAVPVVATFPEAMPQPVPVAAEPPLQETPGWRTRR
jgi:hypothetical protein